MCLLNGARFLSETDIIEIGIIMRGLRVESHGRAGVLDGFAAIVAYHYERAQIDLECGKRSSTCIQAACQARPDLVVDPAIFPKRMGDKAVGCSPALLEGLFYNYR